MDYDRYRWILEERVTRPYVVLSAAVSVDGYLDDASPTRLILSTVDDLDRVDEVRAGVDAILVGANTVRRDNPRLRVRDPGRVRARVARGAAEQPIRVVLTRSGTLAPESAVFGPGECLVYAPSPVVVPPATVVVADDLAAVLHDLSARGVARLLVEGGGDVHTQFLTGGLADELHLVIAPVFVGDPRAPRFLGPGLFPERMTLAEVRRIGDVVLLRYLLERTP